MKVFHQFCNVLAFDSADKCDGYLFIPNKKKFARFQGHRQVNRHLDSNNNVKVPSYERGQFLQPWRAIHSAVSWQEEGSQNEDFTSEVVSTF